MKIITIEREYAAGGHTVGKAVADRLGIEIYDRDIIKQAAAASGITPEQLEAEEERLGGGTSFINHIVPIAYDVKDVVFENESQIILKFAAEGPCVILGRCGGVVLRKAGYDVLRVFLHASKEARIPRAGELLGLTDRDDILANMKRIDRARKAYFEYYTDHRWGDIHDYDLCLNVGELGVDWCVEAIVGAAQA